MNCTPQNQFHDTILADVDISLNPDPFNFWTSESEYIKKTGIRIHFFSKLKSLPFVLKLRHAENTFIWSESIWIHLWPRVRIHLIFCHRIRIQLPLERYGPQPTLSCNYVIKDQMYMAWISLLGKNENLKVMVISLYRPSSAYYSSRSAFCCNE